MHGLTLGQVYVLLEDMADYLRRTNPFGGSEEDEKPDPERTLGSDEAGAIGSLMDAGIGLYPAVNVRNMEKIGADDLDALRRLMGEADGGR